MDSSEVVKNFNKTLYQKKTEQNKKQYKYLPVFNLKKSLTRETKHNSTDADSSTDAIGGWTKNTQKPIFFLKTGKIIKNAKTQKRQEI